MGKKSYKKSSPSPKQPPQSYAWRPQEGPQLDALLATWCNEIIFGGARGGGKTQWLLGDFLQDVPKYAQNWNGILFRRSHTEFEEILKVSRDIYPKSGAEYFVQAKQWKWQNGATLKFAFLERDADAEIYQGHAYQWIGWDELGNYPSDGPYRMMMACLRSGAMEIPTKRIRATANPGGPGHQWVMNYFKIDEHPRGYVPYDDPISQTSRMFIPSRITDNKILLKNDPGYINRLRNLGNEQLVRAWLEGDWTAIQGAFFPEFSPSVHVMAPFKLPDYWPKWCAVDWGYAKPFSVGWYTMSDGTMADAGIPAGSIIKYKEFYGCSQPNVGVRMSVDRFAAELVERSKGEKIEYVALDPSMFIQDGGPSLAETMAKPPFRLPVIRADNKRVAGWGHMRTVLRHDAFTRPKFFIFSTCEHLLRTLPIMQHDKKKFEDMDTEGEDHAVDETRYSIMSRMSPREMPAPLTKLQGIESLTMNRMWDHHAEQNEKVRRF